MTTKKKPTLSLFSVGKTPAEKLRVVAALYRRLTGKEPTEEDLHDALRVLETPPESK